jgi:hypothetical protein
VWERDTHTSCCPLLHGEENGRTGMKEGETSLSLSRRIDQLFGLHVLDAVGCWRRERKNKRTDAIKRKKKKINFKRRKDEYRPKREKKKKKKNERRRRVRSYIGGKCPIQQEEEENGEEEEEEAEEGPRNSARSRSAHTFRLCLPRADNSGGSSLLVFFFLYSYFLFLSFFKMLFQVGTLMNSENPSVGI